MKPKVFLAKSVPREVENYIAEHCDYRKWDSEKGFFAVINANTCQYWKLRDQ